LSAEGGRDLGYTLEEIRDKNAFQLLMAGKKMAGRQTWRRLAGESGRVEAYARRKDGCEAVLLVSYSPVFNERAISRARWRCSPTSPSASKQSWL
jgi:hypothetical protein